MKMAFKKHQKVMYYGTEHRIVEILSDSHLIIKNCKNQLRKPLEKVLASKLYEVKKS